MASVPERFSRRYGFAGNNQGLLVYDDAPERVRVGFLGLLEQDLSFRPSAIRSVVCKELREVPDSSNWSEYPNIWDEAQRLVYRCEWYQFFDIVEAFSQAYRLQPGGHAYEGSINRLFEEERIGWTLANGQLVVRGEEPLEQVLRETSQELEKSDLRVTLDELKNAWAAISRRPAPNLSGAVMHAMAALEAVAKKWSNEPKLALGEIIKMRADIFPPPLNDAVSKLWGFASNNARHGNEDRELDLDEVFLIVGVSATLCTYLARKTTGEE